MKLRLRRPRDLALALRELARRRPHEAVDYLDAHEEEWSSLAESDPHDAADILEAIAGEDAAELISDLDPGDAADVLEEMHEEAAADVLEELHFTDAAAAVSELAPEEAADIVGHLEHDTREAIFGAMTDAQVEDIRDILRYPPDSAGGLMTPEPATLSVGITAGASSPELLVTKVVRHLQNHGFTETQELQTILEDVHFALPPELERTVTNRQI